jgi:hypothetical protein
LPTAIGTIARAAIPHHARPHHRVFLKTVLPNTGPLHTETVPIDTAPMVTVPIDTVLIATVLIDTVVLALTIIDTVEVGGGSSCHRNCRGLLDEIRG